MSINKIRTDIIWDFWEGRLHGTQSTGPRLNAISTITVTISVDNKVVIEKRQKIY